MSVITTFTGFQPPASALRNFEIFRLLAQINRDEDSSNDLLRFSRIIGEVVNLLLFDIDRWPDIFDIDRATEPFVDLILDNLGNPFDFDITLTKKRKLARQLVAIYKLKGTEPGICGALSFFLGLGACDILETAGEDAWILGVSELGVDTILGTSNQRALYSFDVEVDKVLTAAERQQLIQIVDFMKPPHTHLINILEP